MGGYAPSWAFAGPGRAMARWPLQYPTYACHHTANSGHWGPLISRNPAYKVSVLLAAEPLAHRAPRRAWGGRAHLRGARWKRGGVGRRRMGVWRRVRTRVL